jgi:hypothetical protein
MRAEVELTDARPPVPAPARWASRRRPAAGGGPDWFELSLLGIFVLLSVWVLAVDLWQVVVHGRVWTGTDGIYIVDQMQYLAWIKSASHHLLSSNLFVLRHTPADYFMPAITISAGLTALGVAPWLSLLLWKPVAVVATFFAIRSYAHRSLDDIWERRIALALGLFFCSATIIYGSVGTLGDLFPPFLSWGYTFALLAMAVMVFALLAYARARERGGRRGAWTAALLGGLSSLLHPWQGEMLVLMLLGSELIMWRLDRRRPRSALPAIAFIGTALPLLYYLILAHADLSWKLARVESKHSFSILTILLAVLPLLVPALVAYRGRPTSFLAVLTRVWPLAALAIFLVSASDVSATPLHAFQGITIPLAVLAIEGLRRVGFARLPGRAVIATLAVAAVTIPGALYQLRYSARTAAPTAGNPNFIRRDERDALRYLARDPTRGGVLTRFYLGAVVPAETGRRTFVGHCLWSEPGCGVRAQMAQEVFDDSLDDAMTRQVVRLTGARFVLADCNTRADLDRVLAPMTEAVAHFGCAAVYTLRSASPPHGPLAELPLHAALRASGRQQRRVEYV